MMQEYHNLIFKPLYILFISYKTSSLKVTIEIVVLLECKIF